MDIVLSLGTMRYTYCFHFVIVASLHLWLSMLHLLVVVCARAPAAKKTVGMMLVQLFHSCHEDGLQDRLFPENGNLQTTNEFIFCAHWSFIFPFYLKKM